MKKLDIAKWVGIAITAMVLVFGQIKINAIKEVAIDTATVVNIEQETRLDTMEKENVILKTKQEHIKQKVDEMSGDIKELLRLLK